MRDYLAILRPQPKDALQFGVRGMKWGIRRTDSQLAKDHAARKSSGEKVTPTKKAESHKSDSPSVKALTGEESSSQRYARLADQAKQGKASSMSEQDLKFFNARTDALAKINKMNEQNPSWLASTSKKVLQQAAQNTMQSVADGVAKKYISSPILDGLNKAAETKK